MKKSLIICIGAFIILLIAASTFKLWAPSPKEAYSGLPPHSSYLFKLIESDHRIPCLQAEVEGISFLAKLDTGYDGVLSLPKHLLDQLTLKSPAGTVFFAGIKGRRYETSVFTIPRLQIGNLAFIKLPVEEAHLEFERDAASGAKKSLDSSDVVARIGWEAFLGAVVLIDLRRSIAICCDSLETLKEQGYQFEQFASTHFLSGGQSIEFEADVDNRRVKCTLDTGCTLNLIHVDSKTSNPSEEPEFGRVDFAHPLPSTALSVGGSYLGPCIFHETQLPFGTEAILGIDFLETQTICIDFINRKLFLCPALE
jgi:hypothetical protein